MTKRMVLRLLTCALVVAAGVAGDRAYADPLALTVASNTSVQQTDNRPCIIGDPSCQNPDGFDFMLIPSGHEDLTLSSPTYTVAQFRDLLGTDTFWVGLDLSQAPGGDEGAYSLLSFALAVNGTIFFSTTAPARLFPVNAGTGFSDAAITGFSLAGLAGTDRLVFTASYAGDTGGREQYFLNPVGVGAIGSGGDAESPIPIPEPASMVLLGSGLAGALATRRKQQN
jgi:PEP-CTERM motif